VAQSLHQLEDNVMRGLALLTVLAALMAPAPPALAKVDRCAGALDPVRIIECLRPGGINSTTRGIRPSAAAAPAATPAPAASVAATPAPAARAAPAPAPAAVAVAPPAAAQPSSSVDLSVPFAFDSAELTPQGSAALTALGTALKDPSLSTAKFRIAGHTDGKGADAYNQALSERRGEVARRFLVDRGGVDPARLSAIGFGPRQLYDAGNPAAAANRRVQVIRLEN